MVLDNLTLGTQLADALESDTLTDIMNPLGGYNVPAAEILQEPAAENTDQGPEDPPGKKKTATLSFDEIDRQRKQLTENWKNNAAFLAQTRRDPRLTAGRYEYDQYVTNVDRYRGYGAGTFNKLGFNPLEDNEKYYNQNTSWYQDYMRMAPHMFSLFKSSLWESSLPVGIYDLLSNNTPSMTDLEASETQARHMKLGASSRGGIAEFGNNFLLNSAFSFGIIGNVLLEEAAIATASVYAAPASGGASLLAGGAGIAANTRRIAEAWRAGMAMTSLGSLAKMTRSGAQMLTSLNKVDAARTFWQAARGVGTGFIEFANPLRGTTAALRSMNSATGAAAYLNSAAKLSRGFGAFYRDMREFNFTLQEARLEGGSVYDRFVEEQIGKIRQGDPANGISGREPTNEELSKIYQYAAAAGEFHGWTEVPIIFATNRLVFDGLFKFKGIRGLGEAAEQAEKQAAKGIMFDAASRSFKEIPKAGLFGQITRTIKNPRLYAGSFLNYTRANFFEGAQELIQETAGDAIVKHYSQLYDSPENGAGSYLSSHVYSAIGDQVFSPQGLNTFFSGFLMGGLIGGSGRAASSILTKAGDAMMSIKNPEAFKQYVQQKNAAKTDLINSMNKIISDPQTLFSSSRESFVTQKRANDNMARADMNGDGKAFIDAKDEKTFDHVFTALNRGTFDMVINGMKEMGKLNENEIAQAFNLPEGTKAKDKVQEYVKRAEQIKNRYEYFQENIPNPFKPARFKKGTPEHIQEFISYKAYDDARKAAVASQYGFDRALERMNSLTSELSQNRPIASSSASEMTVLLDEKVLKDEIKLLKQEIKSTGEDLTSEQKAIIKQKTKKLEALEEYQKSLKEYRSARGSTKVTETGQIELFQDMNTEDALRNSYQNYLKYIAKVNDDFIFDDKISDSFKKVLDFYELDEDSKAYNKIVNNLLDPSNFERHYERIYNTLNDLYNNREQVLESSMDKFLTINELNSMMIALGQLGVIINPEEIEDMVNKGIMPRTFLDMRTNKPIEPGDSKYEVITEIVKSFKDIQDQTVSKHQEEETDQAEAKPQATKATPVSEPTIDLGIEPELRIKLEDAYNQYIEQTGSDVSFEDFVIQSPTAARIKSQFNKEKPATAAVFTPTTPYGTPTGEPVTTAVTAAPVSDDVLNNNFIVKTYDKPWRNNSSKSNKAKSYALKSKPNEIFELVEDKENGFYSLHVKTSSKDALTEIEKQQLVKIVANAIPIGGKLSSWGEATKGGISALNRFKKEGFEEVGTRKVSDSQSLPILEKKYDAELAALEQPVVSDVERSSNLKENVEKFEKDVNKGWKMHLSIAGVEPFESEGDSTPENEIRSRATQTIKILDDLKAKGIIKHYKVGHDGGQPGKNITVYIGNASKVESVVSAVERSPELRNQNISDNLKLTDKISIRFDAEGKIEKGGAEFLRYGPSGIGLMEVISGDIIKEMYDPKYLPDTIRGLRYYLGDYFDGSKLIKEKLAALEGTKPVSDIEAKKAEADKLTPIEQNFTDGQGGRKMQSQFAGKSTMDLILSGDRTRTTRANTDIQRMLKEYGLTKIEDLVGKVIRMTDKKGRTVYTEITKVAPFTKEYQDATWQQEGWERSVTDKLVGQYPYAIEFKLVALEGATSVSDKKAPVKPGVAELFESNPELANAVYDALGFKKQQAQQLYSQYLDTVFPDSKVKDILYHGSIYPDTFGHNIKNVVYFTKDKFIAEAAVDNVINRSIDTPYFEERLKGRTIYMVLLNIKNPTYEKDIYRSSTVKKEAFDNNDAVIFDGKDDKGMYPDTYGKVINQIAVFEPEQIHILGSKQDIEGFKKFVSTQAPVTEVPVSENLGQPIVEVAKTTVQTTTERTAVEKVQESLDSISSIRDLFDMNSDQAIELINEGISSIDLRKMLEAKRVELVDRISTKDLQKFDIVTFKDGSKIVYVYTKKGKVHVKTQNDAKGEYTVMNEDTFLKKIQNVEPSKKITMEPTQTTPAPKISEQDKKIVASSRDTFDSFANDPARLKSSFDKIMNQEDDASSAENDLLDSLGCDT